MPHFLAILAAASPGAPTSAAAPQTSSAGVDFSELLSALGATADGKDGDFASSPQTGPEASNAAGSSEPVVQAFFSALPQSGGKVFQSDAAPAFESAWPNATNSEFFGPQTGKSAAPSRTPPGLNFTPLLTVSGGVSSRQKTNVLERRPDDIDVHAQGSMSGAVANQNPASSARSPQTAQSATTAAAPAPQDPAVNWTSDLPVITVHTEALSAPMPILKSTAAQQSIAAPAATAPAATTPAATAPAATTPATTAPAITAPAATAPATTAPAATAPAATAPAMTAPAADSPSADAKAAPPAVSPATFGTDPAAAKTPTVTTLRNGGNPDFGNDGSSGQPRGQAQTGPATDGQTAHFSQALPDTMPMQSGPETPRNAPQVQHDPTIWPQPQPSAAAHRVSIDLGDGDSKVHVTIHERGGDISVKFDSASNALHTKLQSSVGTLVEAFRREQVPLANLDFSASARDGSNEPDQRRRRQQYPSSRNGKPQSSSSFEASVDSVSIQNS